MEGTRSALQVGRQRFMRQAFRYSAPVFDPGDRLGVSDGNKNLSFFLPLSFSPSLRRVFCVGSQTPQVEIAHLTRTSLQPGRQEAFC